MIDPVEKGASAAASLRVRVKSVAWETDAIKLYDLRALDRGELPPFTAGAHVDLLLPGFTRSYSLCNSQDERHRYVVGVALDAASRGGSRHIHTHLRPGDVVEISSPRNNFPLTETAAHTILISGGIGVTPMMGMMRRLETLGRSWELHCCARSRDLVAFLDELTGKPERVRFFLDDREEGRFLDIAGLVSNAPLGTHFYCCGPRPMLTAFERATDALRDRRHVEYFQAREESATAGGLVVELARSRKTLHVVAGQTILEAIRAAAVAIESSCEQGICGTCETRVLEGVPDHRDSLLTEEERASNKTMMVCCSGAKSARLVLDI